MTQPLKSTDFLPFNLFEQDYPVKTDLVYAQPEHADNHFRGLYHPDAKYLWGHKHIVPIILLAALICRRQFGWSLKLNDCLRPVEAQKKMAGYGYDPELVSVPGAGAHPRGIAIDIQPVRADGSLEDMGTPFDYFTDDLADNPAARDYVRFKDRTATDILAIRRRRTDLESAVGLAAYAFGQRILPLPQEWWDFRFEKGDAPRQQEGIYWGDYAPVTETELPAYMHLVGKPESVPESVMHQWTGQKRSIDTLVQSKIQSLHL